MQAKMVDEKGELHPVYFWSRKTNDAQRKYHSYELEVPAVIEAIKRFRVKINKKDLSTRVAR
jgi:hypothetical protein